MQSPDIEEWRPVPIPEYAEIYEVSNQGRVRRAVAYIGPRKHRPIGTVLKPWIAGKGYFAVSLWCAGKILKRYVHRLVLEAFAGPAPIGTESCHNNGDKSDNRLSNLRWDTHLVNVRENDEQGKRPKGDTHPHAKLSKTDVLSIRRRVERGETHTRLAQEHGVSPATVDDLIARRTWAHLEEQARRPQPETTEGA